MQPRFLDHFRELALLLTRAARQKEYKSVLFTATGEGHGATTAVLATARLMKASYDLRPLIVELNWRRPVYAAQMNLNGAPGLIECAAGRVKIAECIQCDQTGIAVLPAGNVDDLGVRPDMGMVLAGVLAQAGRDFDFLLVDTPPALEDNSVIEAGAAVPQAVLVVGEGETTRESLRSIRTRLSANDIRIAAVTMNRHKEFVPKWLDRWLS